MEIDESVVSCDDESLQNDDTSSTRLDSVSTEHEQRVDRKLLNKYAKRLENMTINELTANGVEPIPELVSYFRKWYHRSDSIKPKFNLKFDIKDGLKTGLLPKDLFVVELREEDDLYDTYIGMYQHLARYNKDIIDKDSAPIGKIAVQLDWYKKACDLLLKNNLSPMDTLTIDYSYTITNSLNNKQYSNKTKFLLFYYPVGLFESNNILPTQVINRMITRYRFMDKPICFIPSITNSFSNTNDFAVKVNEEFNKLLFSIIKFAERSSDVVLDQYDNVLEGYFTRTIVKQKPYKIDMLFKVTGTKINIFSFNLLPNLVQFNSYYSESFSPFLIDMNKYKKLIDDLEASFKKDLDKYGFSQNLFIVVFLLLSLIILFCLL